MPYAASMQHDAPPPPPFEPGLAPELWFSVDVECSGQTPHDGSLISIGACLVDDPSKTFYVELKPDPEKPWGRREERVHNLTRAHLEEHGVERLDGIRRFAEWVRRTAEAVAPESSPLLIGFNTPFDWMWLVMAFAEADVRNPFGMSAVDLKSVYYTLHGGDDLTWKKTVKRFVRQVYPTSLVADHHALADALEQAELARTLRAVARGNRIPPRLPSDR